MSASDDVARVIRQMRTARHSSAEAARRGLDLAGEHLIGAAQDLAPVDTGALKASGTTEPAEASREGLTKTIGFNTTYAAAVHERLDANFNTTANPLAQAKFLETPMRERAEDVARFVANEIKGVL